MKKELDDKLVKDYPNLFRERYLSPQQTCMYWGFPGDGWYNLIDGIGKKLKENDLEDKVVADQVKEKFGGLRFYWHLAEETEGSIYDEAFNRAKEIINKAEEKSYITCEDCGGDGKRRGMGYIVTLCDDCNRIREAKNDTDS